MRAPDLAVATGRSIAAGIDVIGIKLDLALRST